MIPELPGRAVVTSRDAQAIRAQVATTSFLHLRRIALEWGISVDQVKSISGKLLTRRSP